MADEEDFEGGQQLVHPAVPVDSVDSSDQDDEADELPLTRRAGTTPARADDSAFPDWTELDPVQDLRWQRLWLETQRRPWIIMAVVPAAAGRSSVRAACALAAVGRHHLARPVDVIDATPLELVHLEDYLDDLVSRREANMRTLVALASPLHSPAGLALARAVDAALLCVRFGDSIAETERTIEDVGYGRFIGSFVLKEEGD